MSSTPMPPAASSAEPKSSSGTSTGKMMSGSSAVAGIGMASVIHQMPISTAVAAVSRGQTSRSAGMMK